MEMTNLNVCVTGGAGFIGSHLVDLLLEKGNQVKVIDNFSSGKKENLAHIKNSNLEVVEADICDLKRMQTELKGTEIVFHLATHCVRASIHNPILNHEVNASGTLNVLHAAQDSNSQKFIYCSSSEIYGNSEGAKNNRISEETEKKPVTVYGASKLTGELYTTVFQETYGLDTVIIRPFNTYGPRSHFQGAYGEVIPRFAIQVHAGKPPTIFGDGKQTRDFMYVTDTVKGMLAIAEHDAANRQIFNLAVGEEVSIRRIAKEISSNLGFGQEAEFLEDRPGDVRRLWADPSKAQKLTSWKAEIDIQSGIKKYLEWLKSQKLNYSELIKQMEIRNW